MAPVRDGIQNNGVFGGVESGVVELVSHVHVEISHVWNAERTPVFEPVAGLHHQRLRARVNGQGSRFVGPDVTSAGAVCIGCGAKIDTGMQSTIPCGGIGLEADVSVGPILANVVVNQGELSAVPLRGVAGVGNPEVFQVGK